MQPPGTRALRTEVSIALGLRPRADMLPVPQSKWIAVVDSPDRLVLTAYEDGLAGFRAHDVNLAAETVSFRRQRGFGAPGLPDVGSEPEAVSCSDCGFDWSMSSDEAMLRVHRNRCSPCRSTRCNTQRRAAL